MKLSFAANAALTLVNTLPIQSSSGKLKLHWKLVPADPGNLEGLQVKVRQDVDSPEITVLDIATLNWAAPADVAASGVEFASFDGPTPVGDTTDVALTVNVAPHYSANVYLKGGNATLWVQGG